MRGGFLGKPHVESRDDPGDMVACIVHAISSVFKWTVLLRCVVLKKKVLQSDSRSANVHALSFHIPAPYSSVESVHLLLFTV